ncbi:hypothetical protein [Bacillus sp. PS06]|nr:hypothetical protein [Bacillus sp. PS06]MBD8067698.1 hypothetical protein [Bacillus sp. PS06]
MNKEKAISIANEIIQLDLLRDELYEELVALIGNKAAEVLRIIQNS